MMGLREYNEIQLNLFEKYDVVHFSVTFYKLCSFYALFRQLDPTEEVLKVMDVLTQEEIEYEKATEGKPHIRCYAYKNGISVTYKRRSGKLCNKCYVRT